MFWPVNDHINDVNSGTYALGFQTVAVGSITRGFLQGYDYTRGDFSGFVTNQEHFGTAFFLSFYTQMPCKPEIKTCLGLCHYPISALNPKSKVTLYPKECSRICWCMNTLNVLKSGNVYDSGKINSNVNVALYSRFKFSRHATKSGRFHHAYLGFLH